jgi:hypothetical protein
VSNRKIVAVAVAAYAVYLAVYISQEGWVLMPKPTHWWWWAVAGIMLGLNIGYQFSEWENRSVQRKHDRLRELEAENREMFLALRQVLIDTVKVEHDKRIVELEHMKAEAEREKLVRLLPSLVRAFAERLDVEDKVLVSELAEILDEKTVAILRDIVGAKSPEVAALLVSCLEKKKTEKA